MTEVIILPDDTVVPLAGAKFGEAPSMDVFEHGDSPQSLIDHGVVIIRREFGAGS